MCGILQPVLGISLVTIAYSLAGISWDGTPQTAFDEFFALFGTDTRANLYFAYTLGSEIGAGDTVLPGCFYFSPTAFYSDFVAIGVTPGSLTSGNFTADNLLLISGTANVPGDGGDDDDPVSVPEPGTLLLLFWALFFMALVRLLIANKKAI